MRGSDQQEFVTRQYAGLIQTGMNEESARTRLGEVLGAAALRFLDVKPGDAGQRAEGHVAARLMDAARRLGGDAAATQAAFAHATGEARLLALDWWRPIRTFLLYVAFLLALAILVAIVLTIEVLPVFRQVNRSMSVLPGGAYGADSPIRLFVPLLLIAVLLALLAIRWYRMRRRMARLQPFAGQSRSPWLNGRAGTRYRVLRCLEYAAALKAGGVADESVLEAALRLSDWPHGKPFGTRADPLGEQLEQARRLGTFGTELEWQRRACWSTAQSGLELARDRLTLFSRVIFYILIGYMVTQLYIPIFSLASLAGGHF